LTDRALRKSLIANGRENIKRFSWDATAKETIKVYELVLNATSHP
jgi:glycosyltransferase involved in cell wall biosynthesis